MNLENALPALALLVFLGGTFGLLYWWGRRSALQRARSKEEKARTREYLEEAADEKDVLLALLDAQEELLAQQH